MRRIRPNLPIVFVSGHGEHEIAIRPIEKTQADFLHKRGLAAWQLAIAQRRVTIWNTPFPRRIACIACSSSPSRSC